MFIERDSRGRFQQVRNPKDKGKYGRLKPTGTILDPPIWIDPGETPLPLSTDVFSPAKGKNHQPPNKTRLPDRSRRPPADNVRDRWVMTASAAKRYLPQQDQEGGPPDNARDCLVTTASAANRYLPQHDREDHPRNNTRDFRVTTASAANRYLLQQDREDHTRDNTKSRRVTTASAANRYLPHQDQEDLPPNPEPEHHPPAREIPRGTRPPARPPGPANHASKDPRQRFNVERVIVRDPKELYEESSLDISPNTGTEYPCTQRDLDACGGKCRRASRTRDPAELRAMWFSQPNKGPLVGVRAASRDIFDHNDPERTGRVQSVKEHEAIGRLLAMLETACHDSWGPDLAIKSFCDLDTVFFRGKLKGNVCITWAGPEEFTDGNCFGHTFHLGQSKALIQLNARYMFFDWGCTDGRLFTQMLATVLHEMIHAYQVVNCPEHGRDGFDVARSGPNGYHDKNFGTMMRAVNNRAFDLLGLRGDPNSYPRHDYSKGKGIS